MEYFSRLLQLLKIEKEEDRKSYEELNANLPVAERRAIGMSWYPVAIRDTELTRGDYLTVELERTTHHEVIHQLRFGMSAALFSNHDPRDDRIEATISHISGNRLRLTLRSDELPEWTANGKLGVDAVFDKNSYDEMEAALKQAAMVADDSPLIQILLGRKRPGFHASPAPLNIPGLNTTQNMAVGNILSASELAVVHGPPGTGKTTTLVQAIKLIIAQDHSQVLVTAPSNAAVDLLSERLSDEQLHVVRVGNPARVNDRQLALTLDSRIAAHGSIREIKRLKKQAADFRDMAHKYKRSFGYAEREQRKALFAEARNIGREVERLEQYIVNDVLSKANVITATLVGANHYTIRNLKFHTVIIDEAGQALEPACWIPVLKAQKLVMAGDHNQLSPTIKSREAAEDGLSTTLMEKAVALHPEAVTLLEEQYRMHETIMGYSSAGFYEGRLKAHASVANRLLFPGDHPLLFIDTAGCGFEEKWEGTSLSNPEEASLLLRYLASFIEGLPSSNSCSVAVISPYKHQVEVLKELASSYALLQEGNVAVNTIDSFQGQERDIVCISMTRSNTENDIGFLSDIRRMNVAMTRARKKLIVVGDSATLSRLPFYADFISYAEGKDGYRSAWEMMEF